jgi:hypothetical protein
VRVAVLLATVPAEQAAANNRLESNIKPKIFLGSFMIDAPSGLCRKLSIFSVLFKVGRGKKAIIRPPQWIGMYIAGGNSQLHRKVSI